jgi:hypothetical protein
MNTKELAPTHVRVHGNRKFMLSMDFEVEPEIIIGYLVKLQAELGCDK